MSLFKKNLYLFILIQFISLAMTSLKAEVYSKLALQQMAIEFVQSNLAEQSKPHKRGESLSVTALPLDSRIEQRACDTQLELSSANPTINSRQSTIKIKCLDENTWQVYVFIKQAVLVDIVIAAKGISKGQKIHKDDVSIKQVAKHLARSNQFTDINQLIGGRSKRNVRVGQPINYNHICNVCKGDRITIIAELKGMAVKTLGEALQDGQIGDNIRVKNVKSGKTIQAQVTSYSTVKVAI